MSGRRYAPVLMAALVLTAAGCGSSSPEQPQQTSPSSESAPSAADGSDVTACADASCEVLVEAGTALPVPESTNIGDLTVDHVTTDSVTVAGAVLGNSSSGYCTGQRCSVESSNGEFTATLGENSTAAQNGLSMTVLTIADTTAVLQFEPLS